MFSSPRRPKPSGRNLNHNTTTTGWSRWLSSEAFFLILGSIAYWIFSVFFSNMYHNNNVSSSQQLQQQPDSFLQFLKQFAQKGGIRNMFPGDDSRDSSIQFELISQVHCTTSVGKPISITVRNTPTDRRRMRMFGGF
nr:unnamed protein product [Naegleria fowleri]